MAGVFKRKNGACWYACWKVGRKTVRKSTGVPLQGEKGESPSKAKLRAQAVADAMERAAKGLEPLDKSLDAVRFAAASSGLGCKVPSVREFLASVPRTASPQSENNRQRAFNKFLEFLGADAEKRVDLVQGETCRRFVRWALESVSRGTVEHYKKNLSAAFKRAVEVEGLMERNPFAAVNMGVEAKEAGFGEDRTKRKPFTVHELKFMMEAFPSPWCDMVAASFYLAGARLSDVCLLRWDSIDWEAGVVRFAEVKTKNARALPLHPALREVLERWRARSGGEEFVFPSMAARYKSAGSSSLSSEFTAYLRTYGIIGAKPDKPLRGNCHDVSEKSFHSIRHSVVSLLRKNPSLTPDVVRDAVGHESEEVERGYFSSDLEDRGRVLDALCAALAAGGDDACGKGDGYEG